MAVFGKQAENIKKVANLADKWELKVVYDSHQFHTSNWLDPKWLDGLLNCSKVIRICLMAEVEQR